MMDFRRLKIWTHSHALALAVYSCTKHFPADESFGLTAQLRRACASIPANIAEGCGRDGTRELRRFLMIAKGSASEAEYHLLLARDLAYMDDIEYDRLSKDVVEVKRMLTRFIQALNARLKTSS